MQIERSFKISCPHFGGYVVSLSVNDFDSLEEVVAAVLDQLKATLAASGFEALLSTLDTESSKYHIHDRTIEDVLMGVGGSPYYVCNHGCLSIPTQVVEPSTPSMQSVGVLAELPSAPANEDSEESDSDECETKNLL